MKKSYLKRIMILVISMVMGWTMVLAQSSSFCQTEIYHLGIEAEAHSKVALTITNIDENKVSIVVEKVGTLDLNSLLVESSIGNMNGTGDADRFEVILETSSAPETFSISALLWNGFIIRQDNYPELANIPFLGTCSGIEPGEDEYPPTNFAVTTGNVTSRSIELLLSAEDNSGRVNFVISRDGATDISVNGVLSGDERSYIVTGLDQDTEYTFTVIAKDAAGNEAENNPLTITVKTLINQNTECSGESDEAQQESFEIGYIYSFSTQGTDVIVEFELLDSREGLVALAWLFNPGLTEVGMIHIEGNKFTQTFSDQIPGSTFSVACKFAYAGGMAVTKTFEYTVGNNCDGDPSLQLASISGNELAFIGTWDEVEFLDILDNEGVNLETITSLDLTAVSGVDAKPAGLNCNCLLYVDESANVNEDNIVKVGITNTAGSIILTDNYPFNNSKEFTTSNIVFSRTGINQGHFSTLYIPFATAKPAGMTAYTFTEVAGTSVRFAELEGETLAANTAYLFKIDDIVLELATTTTEVTIEVTSSPTAEMNTFVGTYTEIIPTGDYYGYSSNEFVKGNETKVVPFRAYLQGDPSISADAPSRYGIEIKDGGATNMDINIVGDLVIVSANGGLEVIAAQAQQADIYGIDGRLVRSISLSEGINYVDGLSQGIYLMNNQKVVVK